METARTPRRVALALLTALLLAGCAGVDVACDPEFALREGDTFAWAPSVATSPDVPLVDLQLGIGKSLVKRGLTAAPPAEADVLVDAEIDIDVITAGLDPLYGMHVAERFEQATFDLELRRRGPPGRTGVWRGTTEHRLRTVERAVGTTGGLNWQTVDEERDWPIADVVARLDQSVPRVR